MGLILALVGCDALWRVDGIAPLDAPTMASGPIEFVQNATTTCNGTMTCAVPLAPPIAAGHRVLVTVTYDTLTTPALAVTDDAGSSYSVVIAPVQWGSGLETTTWSTTAVAAIRSVDVALDVKPSAIDMYVNEYTASAVDRTAHDTGVAGGPGAFSSGSGTTSLPDERVFGHAEADLALISAGSGFAIRSAQNGNVEEDELAATPGDYAATFSLNTASSWVALMIILR
jgi:hypothetical protein